MKPRLVDYLRCPNCQSQFRLENADVQHDEVISSVLACLEGHKFQVSNGVPRLLVEAEGQEQVKRSYERKWRVFEDVTFSKHVMDFQYNWYMNRFGWASEEEFKSFLESKSSILDAGCGVGRAVGWFSMFSHGEVFGVDISEAVDIAYKRYGNLHNTHLVQGDLTNLPFEKEMFDFISCDQVLHHVPNPKNAFGHLLTFLRKRGEIALYLYRKKGPIREFCDDYIRERTTKMTAEECMEFAKAVTSFGKSLSELNVKIEVPEDIPILDVKSGTYDLQRFIYWNVFKCFWDEEGSFARSLAVNFDWYHPKHAYRYTPDQVKGWCKEYNLQLVNFNVIQSGISMRAVKPQS